MKDRKSASQSRLFQKTVGKKQKVDAFLDVKKAVDEYCRKKGLIKSIKEHMDDLYLGRRKR